VEGDPIDFEAEESGLRPQRRKDETEIHFINNSEEYNETIGEPPEIDFENRTVMAVLLGYRPSSGYYIRVEEIIEQENRLIIEATESRPEGGRGYFPVVTHPYHVVSFEKMEEILEVELDITVEERGFEFKETIPSWLLLFFSMTLVLFIIQNIMKRLGKL